MSKITKKGICAILPAYYGREAKERKHLNNVLVQMLPELIDKSPKNMVSPVSAAPGAAQTKDMIDEIPKNIVVSPVAVAPGAAQTIKLF